MSFQLRPARHQVADMKRIIDLGPSRLTVVHERLAGIKGVLPDPPKLLHAVRDVVEDLDAQSLIRQLLSLSGLVRQSGQSIQAVVNGVGVALANEKGDDRVDPTVWQTVENEFSLLLGLDCVQLATKAIELSYDYANLLQSTKVLTDIRPLYSDSADAINGAVVSFTLRLQYTNADGEYDLSIALDDSDIRNLLDQCRRTITKASTARAFLTDKCQIPVAIFGESEND